MSTSLLFIFVVAALLLSLLMLAEALPSRRKAVGAASTVVLGGSCPLLASSKIKYIGPTASKRRAWVLASCLSLAFVCADSLDLRTLSIFGEAVTAVCRGPYFAFHCLLTWLCYKAVIAYICMSRFSCINSAVQAVITGLEGQGKGIGRAALTYLAV